MQIQTLYFVLEIFCVGYNFEEGREVEGNLNRISIFYNLFTILTFKLSSSVDTKYLYNVHLLTISLEPTLSCI